MKKNQGLRSLASEALRVSHFFHGCPTLVDVVRIVVEVRAVVSVGQGVEDLGINAVLNTMDRTVGKDGIHAGRMRRSEMVVRASNAILRAIWELVPVEVARGVSLKVQDNGLPTLLWMLAVVRRSSTKPPPTIP